MGPWEMYAGDMRRGGSGGQVLALRTSAFSPVQWGRWIRWSPRSLPALRVKGSPGKSGPSAPTHTLTHTHTLTQLSLSHTHTPSLSHTHSHMYTHDSLSNAQTQRGGGGLLYSLWNREEPVPLQGTLTHLIPAPFPPRNPLALSRERKTQGLAPAPLALSGRSTG